MINKLKLFIYNALCKLVGKDYLYDQLFFSFKELEEGEKQIAFERMQSVLGVSYVNHRLINSFRSLKGDDKEQVYFEVKQSLGSDYLNSKAISSWSKLESSDKTLILSKVKSSLGSDFVMRSVISDFAVLDGQMESEMFNLISDSFGDSYIRVNTADKVVNSDEAEKAQFFNQVINSVGIDFAEKFILERWGTLSREKKNLVFPKVIEHLGEPYFKTQVIKGVELFNHGGKEGLFNKVYEILGLKFLYQKLRLKLQKTDSMQPSDDVLDVGLNLLSKELLEDVHGLLGPQAIDEQYLAYKIILPKYSDIFASQEGEDILLKRLMKKRYNQNGFYVDVGAHDPLRFSTTLHYYLRGWKGINIDPLPGMKHSFDEARPRDINIECGISQNEDSIEYYMFEESAFNTFSKSNYLTALEKTKLVGTTDVITKPLSKVLKTHMPEGESITFMTIDVEGLEMEVVKSNDWKTYRPQMLCIEALSLQSSSELDRFLSSVSYSKVASTKNSSIFLDDTIAFT